MVLSIGTYLKMVHLNNIHNVHVFNKLCVNKGMFYYLLKLILLVIIYFICINISLLPYFIILKTDFIALFNLSNYHIIW